MESLIIAYDKNMHWIYPDLNSVLSKKFHFLWNGPAMFHCIQSNYFNILVTLRYEKFIKDTQQGAVLQSLFSQMGQVCSTIFFTSIQEWNSLPNHVKHLTHMQFHTYQTYRNQKEGLWVKPLCMYTNQEQKQNKTKQKKTSRSWGLGYF